MSLLAPLRVGILAGVNPVAKLAVVVVTSVALLLTIDWVSAAVALLLECALIAVCGLPFRKLLLRTSPLLLAALLAGITTLLYGQPHGRSYLHWWAVEITDGSISLAIATLLRILAIGVPAIVLLITIDPTDLADGLAQILRLPARFVVGGLAALRLVGLFLDDWRSLQLARRARGIADTGRLRRLASSAFALLVLSIRRGSKLATAMESRGFGAARRRTWARESTLGARDWIVIAIGCAVAAIAVTTALATGSWHFVVAGS